MTKVLESPVGSRVGKQMGTQKLDTERYLTLHVYADKEYYFGDTLKILDLMKSPRDSSE